jgi:hypothetical protein
VAGSCKDDNKTPVSIKDGEFIGWLSDYQLLKNNSVPWS